MNTKFLVSQGEGYQVFVDLMADNPSDVWVNAWGQDPVEVLMTGNANNNRMGLGITAAIYKAKQTNEKHKLNFDNAIWLKNEIDKCKKDLGSLFNSINNPTTTHPAFVKHFKGKQDLLEKYVAKLEKNLHAVKIGAADKKKQKG